MDCARFARLLELCDTLEKCDKLRDGWFKLWAGANCRREIAELITAAVREANNGNTGAAPRE